MVVELNGNPFFMQIASHRERIASIRDGKINKDINNRGWKAIFDILPHKS